MYIHVADLPDMEELFSKIEDVNKLNETSSSVAEEQFFSDTVKLVSTDYKDFIDNKMFSVPPQISLDTLIEYHDYFGAMIALGESLKGLARTRGYLNAKIPDGKGGFKEAPITAKDTLSKIESRSIDALISFLEAKYKNIYQRLESLRSRNNKF